MNKKRNIIISVILTIISVIYTYLVKVVDVKEIGPNNSSVGFSTINNWFKNLVGSNMTIYKITEVLLTIKEMALEKFFQISFFCHFRKKKIIQISK